MSLLEAFLFGFLFGAVIILAHRVGELRKELKKRFHDNI